VEYRIFACCDSLARSSVTQQLNNGTRGMGILRLLYRIPWLLAARDIRIGERSLGNIVLNWWSGMTCSIFGLKRSITGAFPAGAQLVAANHISWLDIQLLHSVSPMGFVAKAEIQDWKLAGKVATFGDTVFHQRGSHDSSSASMRACSPPPLNQVRRFSP
jgi:1-acyl-sn-glycerol-3-phosphate acyltransferase